MVYMKTIILLLSAFSLTFVICGEVFLEPGIVRSFTFPGYPNGNDKAGIVVFNYKSSPGSNIIAYCEDFRLSVPDVNPCEAFTLKFSDGETSEEFCERNAKVYYRSNTPTLSVVMKCKSPQMVSCQVRSTEEPPAESIILTREENSIRIEPRSVLHSHFDKVWKVSASENAEVRLNCFIGLQETKDCHTEVFEVETADGKRNALCGEVPYESYTRGDFKLRLIMNGYSSSAFYCVLDAEFKPVEVTKPIKTTVTNLTLNPGDSKEFENPNIDMRDYSFAQHTFNVMANGDAKMRLHCYNMYIPNLKKNSCDDAELRITDGITTWKECESKNRVTYDSHSQYMVIEIKYRSAMQIYCEARSYKEPEPIENILEVSDGRFLFYNPAKPNPYYDSLWVFKSVSPARLSLQCFFAFAKREGCFEETGGYEDGMFIDAGDGVKPFCDYKKIILFSKENDLKVRVRMGKHANAWFKCTVQAVSGPNPNEYENLQYYGDEDSSEYGEPEGHVKTTCKCGWRNHGDAARIVNGKITNAGEYPWMVAIRSPGGSTRCGGSIITAYHVLTAAHCMVNEETRKKDEIWETIIAVGVHDELEDHPNMTAQRIPVKEVFIPEPYWTFEAKQDISVLFLEKEIIYTDYIGPVCLFPVSPKLLYKTVKITGWGLTKVPNDSTKLRETNLYVHPNDVCLVPEEFMICAYRNGTYSCNGDSGGPFVYLDPDTNRYTQVALVSYGTNWECTSATGMTNVTYFYSWIEDVIAKTMPMKLCTKETA